MRALPAALVLASLAACAGPATSTTRALESPAEHARPGADPALQGRPQRDADVLPIEQVSVRVHRASDGRVRILEFLSPGLPESEQVALRLAYEEGKLRLATEAASSEESWITTLFRPRSP